jgi:hypothetical protein
LNDMEKAARTDGSPKVDVSFNMKY